MALTNAERQARHRERVKKRTEQGVTPSMVRDAIRLVFDYVARINNEGQTWDAFLKSVRGKRGARMWAEMAPEGSDPDDYWDDLTDQQLELLTKVGAVVEAIRKPPPLDE